MYRQEARDDLRKRGKQAGLAHRVPVPLSIVMKMSRNSKKACFWGKMGLHRAARAAALGIERAILNRRPDTLDGRPQPPCDSSSRLASIAAPPSPASPGTR